jgi:hypothetical protein
VHRAELPGQLLLGEGLPLPVAADYPLVRVTAPNGATVVWGNERPVLWNGAATAGYYQVTLVNRDGGEAVYAVGVNAGNLVESDISRQEWVREKRVSGATSSLGTERQVDLRPWLLILALFFLLMEARLAWR